MFRTILLLLATVASAARAADSIRLFNGKDLSGWAFCVNEPNAKMEDVWSVKDGVLHCAGHPTGYIRTEKDYTNYVLKVQWRFIKPGNSGVLLRIQAPPDHVWPQGIEAQLNTGDAGDIWNIGDFPMKTDPARTGGRRTTKLHDSSEKPMGEWNQYEITIDGPKLELKVNGVVQNTASDCAEKPGKICLQSEGAEIEFRNIELTPLPEKQQARREGPTRLFNGKDLSGWSGYMKDGSNWQDTWSADKGILHYAGGKDGFLISDQDFGHYLMRVQYRFVDRPGDSGVLLRCAPEQKIWPRSLEAQGQSGDAGDIWLLGAMKADAKGSHVKKLNASSEKPIGQWNQYDILANGDKVELRVNYVLQNKLAGVDTTPGRIALQAQDAAVDFKEIELWPLDDPAHPPEYQRLPGLDGWHITGVGNWTYHDGIIEGQQSKDVHTYTHVVSDKSYHNFVATLKYNCPQGNSGFYFRVIVDATGNVHGFQAEIDEKRDAGGLYESWGRQWVSQPKKEDVAAHYKIGQWNDMRVEAKDSHVVVYVNDWKAAEIDDPNVVMEGPCALQIHGGQDVHVMFKDINIQPLD